LRAVASGTLGDVQLGIYSRFTKAPDGRGFDIWAQRRGTVVSPNIRWADTAGPIARAINRDRYSGQYWVCVARRSGFTPRRRWRYGPWAEDEARDLVDNLYLLVGNGQWKPRDPTLRPAGFQQRFPGTP
jgi:hypothetical protein